MFGRHLKLLLVGILAFTIARKAVSGTFCSRRLVGGKWITRGGCGDEAPTQARIVKDLQDAVLCGERKVPRNGIIDRMKIQYMPGDVIKFKCNDGYSLAGNDHDICLDGGSWASNETPRCAQNGTALCEMRKGFYYHGKCYTIAIPDSGGIVHSDAGPECAKSSLGAWLAEFEHRNDQEALKDFVIATVQLDALWVGMEYDNSDSTLHYLSGSTVQSDALNWMPGFPSPHYKYMTVQEHRSTDELLLKNVPMDKPQIGALCEKYYG